MTAAPILILDGGLGTSLEQKYGCTFGPQTPLWSSDLLVSDRATLLRCQADFGDVPVDILLTATYQVSEHAFAKTFPPSSSAVVVGDAKHSPDEAAPQREDITKAAAAVAGIPRSRIPEYIDTALRIGTDAKRPDAHLALSIGPYGACMVPSQEYSGRYDEAHASAAALYAWHRDRLRLFAAVKGGLRTRVAYVALETIPRVDEIMALRRALASVPEMDGLPVWMSCLFPGEDGRLPDGSSVADAVRAMLDPGTLVLSDDEGGGGTGAPCWGIGINCTKVYKLDGLLRQYEEAVAALLEDGTVREWPALVLYPDGTNGEVYNTTTQKWELPDTGVEGNWHGEGGTRVPWAKKLAEVVRQTRVRVPWKQIVVGGCCMASAEDISALRAELL